MKKFLALLLALCLALGCAAAFAETVNPDDIDDNCASADNTFEVAFVTDVGQLKDKSFNQGTWNGVKRYAYENGKTYKYYQPANEAEATDDDRYDAMKAAVDGGAKIVVAAGFLQASALSKAAEEFKDVDFVFIDGWTLTGSDGAVLPNVASIAFQEEQCGYFAGYAVVREGYTKLGFAGGGGGSNDACCRYGWGYVQGANDAAKELGITVDMRYTWRYGANFQPSPDLLTLMNGWYATGTEIVFSCGGSIFDSITAAAAANDAAVIGVDVDQSAQSDTVVTSALKDIALAAYQAIARHYEGTFSEIGGTTTVLGVNEGDVGLPTDTWQFENYTVEEYEQLLAAVKDGTVVIDGSALQNGEVANQGLTNVNIEYID